MGRNRKHIEYVKFRKYLDNRMSGAERNRLERELQKSPFEEEALEGMESVSEAGFREALNELKDRINSRNEKRSYIFYFRRIAAIAILLVVAGIAWFTIIQPLPQKQLAKSERVNEKPIVDGNVRQEEPEIAGEKAVVEEKAGKVPGMKPAVPVKPGSAFPSSMSEVKDQEFNDAPAEMVAEEKLADVPDIHFQEEKAEEIMRYDGKKSEIALMEKKDAAISYKPEDVVKTRKTGTPATGQIRIRGVSSVPAKDYKIRNIQGQVSSLPDNSPLPGVQVVEKGTRKGTVTDSEGRFRLQMSGDTNSTLVMSFVGMKSKEVKPDSDSLKISLEPDQVALNETVVVGYGTTKNKSVAGGVSPVQTTSLSFREYAEMKALLPADYPMGKATVKIGFTIAGDGTLTGFTNENDSGDDLFKRGIEIIQGWGQWKPRLKNGKPVGTKEVVRIEFQKRN